MTLVRVHDTNLVLARLAAQTREYATQSLSPNTLRAYKWAWDVWVKFCDQHNLDAKPVAPESVALFLTQKAEKVSVSTLENYLAALAFAYSQENPPDPTTGRPAGKLTAFPIVKSTMAGIRRVRGTAKRQAAPLTVEQMKGLCDTLPHRPHDRLRAVRDKAMLLVGYASASRRSEIVAFNVGDVRIVDDGLWLTVRRSKTDQDGKGMLKAIPYGKDPQYCPVRSLLAWMEVISPVTAPEYPLFPRITQDGLTVMPAARLHAGSIYNKVKKGAARSGILPTQVSAHSLRAGLLTEAAKAGVPLHKLMAQSGHKTPSVLLSYIRDAEAFKDNAAGSVL